MESAAVLTITPAGGVVELEWPALAVIHIAQSVRSAPWALIHLDLHTLSPALRRAA